MVKPTCQPWTSESKEKIKFIILRDLIFSDDDALIAHSA